MDGILAQRKFDDERPKFGLEVYQDQGGESASQKIQIGASAWLIEKKRCYREYIGNQEIEDQ